MQTAVVDSESSRGIRSPANSLWAPVVAPLGAMIVAATIVVLGAKIDPSALFLPYYYVSFGVSLLTVLAYIFVEIGRLAPSRADNPLQTIAERLRQRLPLLALPFIAFPTFMIAFTTAKTGIPFLVGYGWETFWADADSLLFGQDVWRYAYYLPPGGMRLMEQAYAWWGLIVHASLTLIALYASPKKVLIFFTATFATWFVGGCLMAYAFSAAGPAFAHLHTPALQGRFAAFHDFWISSFGDSGPIRFSQRYLEAARFDHVAARGGGISAMPSMHVGMVALLSIAAWRTYWFIPAAAFWAVILVASGLTGYHYWIDGLIATAVALATWVAARAIYQARMTCES